jgi:hypothetical protein
MGPFYVYCFKYKDIFRSAVTWDYNDG